MLVFVDSFETYVTAQLGAKWTSAFSNVSIVTSQFRTGSQCVQIGATNGGSLTKNVTAQATYTIGAAVFSQGLAGANKIFAFLDSGTNQVDVRMDGAGTISVTRNGTVLGTATYTLPLNQWRFVEFQATIHPTAGAYEVRVDGVSVLSGSGVNTRNSATSQITQVQLIGVNGQTIYFDDFYLTDTTGSSNTGFLGDVKVLAVLPNAAGSFTGFTRGGTDSGNNWDQVNEASPNTTDYVQSGSVGDRDSYNFADLSVTGTIFGAMLSVYAQKDDAGTRSIALKARSSGTDASSGDLPLSQTYAYYTQVFNTDPATSAAWTLSALNAAEFGMTVTV